MENTFEGWDKAEWAEWVRKLELLSLEQLATLSQAVGISFGDHEPTDKQAFILVLDEVDPDTLELEYKKIAQYS
jgi:hypothetical protein